MPEIELETDRLLIREFRRSDAEDFKAYTAADSHWRHLPVEPPTSESLGLLFEQISALQYDAFRTGYELVATDRQSGAFLGEASLYLHPPYPTGSIGWGVVEAHAGHGIATEMSGALLRFAFATLELHRVQAMCRVENLASRRIMAKLGLREEGIFREHLFVRGEWWSSVQAAILASDPACREKGYKVDR